MLLNRIKTLTKAGIDLFFPRSCIVTGNYLNSNSNYNYLSPTALEKIHFTTNPHCTTCGYPFEGHDVESKKCPDCIELKPVFQHGKTLFLLKDSGKAIIHELKYHGGLHLIADIKKLIANNNDYLNYISGAVLVPVPLHIKKLRKRGYNQSLILAQILNKLNPNTQIQEALIRTKFTGSQTQLSREERLKNVKNAFVLSSKTKIANDIRYIIVDDVFTTGATLNSCASVLQKNGASHIDIITLGHG